MRPIALLALLALGPLSIIYLSGCCGSGAGVDPTGQIAPSGAVRSAASSDAQHDGCSIKFGAECGNSVIAAADIQIMDPLKAMRRLWTGVFGSPAPFRGAAAASAAPECAPAAQTAVVLDAQGRITHEWSGSG